MDEYTGKKFFTIHAGDVDTDAYRDEYVKWLEEQVRLLRAALDWYDFKPVDTKQ